VSDVFNVLVYNISKSLQQMVCQENNTNVFLHKLFLITLHLLIRY